jgi:hypothetical protein
MLNDPWNSGVDEVDLVGYAIRRTGARQFHVGLLYKFGKKVYLRHQCRHLEVTEEEAVHPDYLWTNIAALSTLNKRLIANKMSRAGGDKVPYGIGYRVEGGYIDRKTMKYVVTELGDGLTCSTYIVAALETLGFTPLDRPTWNPTEEDSLWQAQMIDRQVQANPASKEHFEAAKGHVGEPRYRPDQLVASAYPGSWPISQETANDLGAQVVAHYDEKRPSLSRL